MSTKQLKCNVRQHLRRAGIYQGLGLHSARETDVVENLIKCKLPRLVKRFRFPSQVSFPLIVLFAGFYGFHAPDDKPAPFRSFDTDAQAVETIWAVTNLFLKFGLRLDLDFIACS